jgi:hypothetical protein
MIALKALTVLLPPGSWPVCELPTHLRATFLPASLLSPCLRKPRQPYSIVNATLLQSADTLHPAGIPVNPRPDRPDMMAPVSRFPCGGRGRP